MREGILGGSFDPIHNGHLHVAREAAALLALDCVLFIPAVRPPHKRGVRIADAAHRMEMVRLAIAGLPEFEASDVEIRRTGPSYSVDTVSQEVERLGDGARIFFLIGADQAIELDTWHKIHTLAGMCTLTPVTRPGFRLESLDRLKGRLPDDIVDALKSAALDIAPVDVSSTDIRRRVREGRSISGLVPPAVEDYILRHGLYRD